MATRKLGVVDTVIWIIFSLNSIIVTWFLVYIGLYLDYNFSVVFRLDGLKSIFSHKILWVYYNKHTVICMNELAGWYAKYLQGKRQKWAESKWGSNNLVTQMEHLEDEPLREDRGGAQHWYSAKKDCRCSVNLRSEATELTLGLWKKWTEKR